MIADTVVVVLMLIASVQPIQEDSLHREADRKIELRHRLDSVSRVAGREAAEKTRKEWEEVMENLYAIRRDFERIMNIYKK